MKTNNLFWQLLALVVLPLRLCADTSQLITVLDTNIQINGTVRIAVAGGFGDEIFSSVTNRDYETARNGLKLYLNGVLMDGLLPLPTISQIEGSNATPAGPRVILQFTLERNSHLDANRKAWDAFFETIGYGPTSVQVGVGLNNGLAHLSAPNAMTFESRPLPMIIAVTAICLMLFVLLFFWTIYNSSMLRENGPGTPYSLGKAQMAFWGLLVAFCFLGTWVINQRMERLPAQVLILIGISGATGLSSLIISSNRKSANTTALDGLKKALHDLENNQAALIARKATLEKEKSDLGATPLEENKAGELAKLPNQIDQAQKAVQAKKDELAKAEADIKTAATSEKWYVDIISDENGLSFHRFQAALWTLILGIIFIGTVATTFSMPEFENTLLVLMGISNGTYLGFKTQENKPEPTTKSDSPAK